MDWHVTFRVFRYKQDGRPPRRQEFAVEVRPTEYVVDALERIWAEQDRSFVFRHACHHAACGACGMRINGRERLACNTRIDTLVADGGRIAVEPLRNLPVVADLVVDVAPFYERMERIPFALLRSADPIVNDETGEIGHGSVAPHQFESCIECALCFSACPIAGTDPDYVGPAALAAMSRMVDEPRLSVDPRAVLEQADRANGCWRCHNAFECSDVCPAGVDPGAAVAWLRRRLLGDRVGWRLRRKEVTSHGAPAGP